MAASISKALKASSSSSSSNSIFVRIPSSSSLISFFSYQSQSQTLNPISYFSTSSSASTNSTAPLIPPIHHPSPSPQHQENRRGIWSKMLLFVPGALAFGLGSWQIVRRQNKIEMLDYRKERFEMEPIDLNAISPAENPYALEFRRVVCRGVFDEKKSIYVGPRSRNISGVTENGYYQITPLLPVSGDLQSVQSPVLVNRGWVPRSWRDKALTSSQDAEKDKNVPNHSTSSGERHSFWRFWSKKAGRNEEHAPHVSLVEVIGVVRESEKPSIFVPENDPISGQWFYVDVPAIIHACGLPENTTYIEDTNENVTPGNPYSIPKDANSLIRSSVMPQDHLNYTLTWYSLSAAVTFMAYKRLKPTKTRI